MSVLVTGATGFLGAAVVNQILAQNEKVIALLRPTSNKEHLYATVEEKIRDAYVNEVVFENFSQLKSIVADYQPRSIVHSAATGRLIHSPDDVSRTICANVEFGTHLLEACCEAAHDISFIFCGTFWQHSSRKDRYDPNSLYAATKSAFEEIARYYREIRKLKLVGLKFYDNYGARDPRNRLMSYLVQAVKRGESVELSPGWQKIRPLYVDDAAHSIIRAMEHMQVQPYEELSYGVFGDELVSIRELVSIIEKLAKSNLRVNWGARDYRQNEIFEPVELTRLPNWSPRTSLKKGIQKMLGDAA